MMHKALVPVATMLMAAFAVAAAPPKPAPSPNAKCRAAVNRVLPDINFSKVPLEDALDFLRDAADLNLHVNWKALDAAGVNAKSAVDLRLKSVSVRKILNVMMSDLAEPGMLVWFIEDGVLEITTRDADDLKMITIVYDMMDLLHTPMIPEPPQYGLRRGGGGIPGAGTGYGGGLGGEMPPSSYGTGRTGILNRNGGSNNALLPGGVGGGYTGGGGPMGSIRDPSIRKFYERQIGLTEQQKEVVDMIMAATDEKIWKENGGKCAMHFQGGTSLQTLHNGHLIVTAPRWVHEKLGGPVD